MKRLLSLMLAIAMIFALMANTVLAVGEVTPSVTITDATGVPGDKVTVTVSLANCAEATSMRVKYTFTEGLTLDTASSKWLAPGSMMQEVTTKQAIWSNLDAVDVNGQILSLTFTVPTPVEGQTDFDYSISCQVQVKCDAETLLNTTVTGKVTVVIPASDLSLNKESLNLDLNGGKEATLVATVAPANCTETVTWASNNPEVVSVNNGVVTALKLGSATISATVGTITKNCAVTVSCSHDLEEVPAKAPTCLEMGNNQYYTCTACSKAFKADKTTETDAAAETLGTVDHVYEDVLSYDEAEHWYACKTEGCVSKKDKANHEFTWVTDKNPTEDEVGLKHEECACGAKRNEGTEIDKLPHTHVEIQHHAAVAATCTTTGNVEHWTCGSVKCAGKWYGDAECASELPSVVVPVDTNNHTDTEIVDKVTPNCYQPGYTGDLFCNACQTVVEPGSVINPTGEHVAASTWSKDDAEHWHVCTTEGCPEKLDKVAHDFKWVVDQAATEDETGLKHEECECGVKRSENTVIEKLDHVHIGIQSHAAIAATCTTTGKVQYWTCSSSKCVNKFYGDDACQTLLETIVAPIDKDNHVGETALRDDKAATCYTEGYTGDTYCVSCNQVVTAGQIILATNNHVAASAWSKDETDHWHACTTAGCPEKLDKVAHTFQWVEDLAATEDTTGLKHEECVCAAKRSEGTVIAKLPHKHVGIQNHPAVAATCVATGNVEYWTCGSSKCVGIYYGDAECQTTLAVIETPINSNNHGETELRNASVNSCYQDGYTGDIYCTVCNNLVQAGEVILATGNHVGGQVWLKDETNHWQTCTTEGCTATVEKAPHTYVWVEDLAATEDTTGLKHEQCICGIKRNENTVIDKLPHTHIEIKNHAAVAATCVATGNVEYWTCGSNKCEGIYYADAECQTIWENIVTPIDSANHTSVGIVGAVEPTCYQPGYTGDSYCSACEKVVESGTTINPTNAHVAANEWLKDETNHWHLCATEGCVAVVGKAAHAFAWVVDKAATEDETGLKHEECECGVKRNENTVIEKLDHVHVGITHHDAVAATCVATGNVEYWTCSSSKCEGKFYGDAACQLQLETIVVPVNDANHGATEIKGAVEPTCSQAGYTGDTYCTVCSKQTAQGQEVAATGKHTPKDAYLSNETMHWQVCSQCNAVVEASKVNHSFNWIIDKKPTEVSTGRKHEECGICKYTRNADTVVDMLKHAPYMVEGKAATCTEDGREEHFYCGSCGGYYASNNGKIGAVISYDDTIIPATGHTFSEDWLSDAVNHWRACQCEEIADKAAHILELIGVVDATETEEGYTGDNVCSVCAYVAETGETIPCIAVEDTAEEAPAEVAPEDDNAETGMVETDESGKPVIWWIIPLIVAVIGFILLIIKKRKK